VGLLSRLFGSRKSNNGWASRIRNYVSGAQSRSYESAGTSRLNQKHWKNASGSDADGVIFPALEVLRNRSRHEIRNNAYAEGIVQTYACDCVGPYGPKLQVRSDNADWNKLVEDGFNAWSLQADVGGRMHFSDILHLLVRNLFEAGEGLVQHVMISDRSQDVRRRLLVIETDRLSSPVGADTQTLRNGVEVDPKTGRPLRYWILKEHPGTIYYTGNTTQYDKIPAQDVIHLYKMLRPGQTRGVPWLAPALDIFGQLRDLTHHTLLAAEYAAALAVLIFTDHQDSDFDDCNDELDIMDIEPGTMSMLPRGWKASQIKPEQPAAQYTDFKRELLKEVGRAVGAPYLIMGSDAAKHNYSSARMDQQMYWNGIRYTQSFLDRHFAMPNVVMWVQEAYLAGMIARPPKGWRPAFTWNQPMHVDPAKEENAATLRLANGTTTWADECKLKGKDWEEVFEQIAREQKRAKELGLEIDFSALVLSAGKIIGANNSDDDGEDDDE
jgi:lambda family phage portal protein